MAKPKLDKLDKRILAALQCKADISIPDLGSRVGLSYSPCLRRVRRLEGAGLIRGKVAILDPVELGLSVNVIVDVYLKSRKDDARGMFEAAVLVVPEIVECYAMPGQRDFVLRAVVADVTSYRHLHNHVLVHLPEVDRLEATFALAVVKYTTALPIGIEPVRWPR